MARAKRHYFPGHIWHITHRCHKQEFLFKFTRDKKRLLEWFFQAKKRYGLVILNYIVTSNHIHLLVKDNGGRNVIPKSIQLIAGRTGQEYNQRKKRKGAFWEDRYHATAVQSDRHLIQCLAYIDLNMVRAGVVKHPSEWAYGGYNEILNPKSRYGLINHDYLIDLLNMESHEELAEKYKIWIGESLKEFNQKRDRKWTQSIAVGDLSFIEKVKKELGFSAIGRKPVENGGSYHLQEEQTVYGFDQKPDIAMDNAFLWDTNQHRFRN